MTYQIGDKVKVDGQTGTVVKVKGQYVTVEIWSNATRAPKLMRLEYKAKFVEAA